MAGGSEYLRFILENRRFLGFGLLAAALSGFGQTFATGLSPPATGLLLDWGVSVGVVIGGLAVLTAGAGVLAAAGRRRGATI
ncbi:MULTISPECIES: hypothetical protein [unclassified Halorhodospira]|uniref:hypothetical protein n=1 Tax=unclassified Halorhodospira TaxID=2626748 RepID=UPI001EE82EC6|nr:MULTISPECIES: hypothetical protein [unclassified Halorhodospira]MCG5540445.1 hypothetical protein [Halorhodospira sp. M39old]MCG5545702.1 hypothetical protein [Halorhodospira sp. M38]